MHYLRFLQDSRKMNAASNEGGSEGAPPATPPAKADPPPAGISPEQMQAAIDKAVASNNATRDQQEAGLKKNKEDLHAEKKLLEQQMKDNADALRMQSGDVKSVTAEISTRLTGEFQEKFAEQQKEIAKFKTEKHNNTIEAFVNEIVELSNIKPAFRNGRKLEIMAGHEIKQDESGNLTIDGRNPKEFVSNWLETSKHVNDLVLAPASNGGGAAGAKIIAGATGHGIALGEAKGNIFTAAADLVNKK